MHTRVTYRGVGLFASGEQIDRAQAFGSSSTLTREDVFELGNKGIVGVVDENEEVQMTIDSLEYGSVATLAKLHGDTQKTSFDLAADFEYASVPIWNYISPGNDGIIFTEFMEASSLTGLSLNYSVDGDSTESYTLMANGKRWILGDKPGLKMSDILGGGGADEERSLPSGVDYEDVVAAYVNGRNHPFSESAGSGITLDGISGSDDVKVVYRETASDARKFVPNVADAPTKRRGHIELEIVYNHNPFATSSPFVGTTGTRMRIGVQSVSADASLDREPLYELGRHRYVDRPLNYPLNITVGMDIRFKDLELFARLCGVDVQSASELDIAKFKNDIGAVITVYDRRDIDEGARIAKKEIHIPYLIPTDEAFNISLDGNATQTFSFRTHNLGIKAV